MNHPAWDIMVGEDTYELLQDWYGKEVELQSVVYYMDREGIKRLLDHIIDECRDSPDDEYFKDFMLRAKNAKKELE